MLKRSLSSREIILIAILIVLALAAAYYLLWYTPMTQERDSYEEQVTTLESQVVLMQARVKELERIKKEIAQNQAQGRPMRAIATYDNLKPLITQLNTILSGTQDFSLSFGEVDTSTNLVRRNVSLTFLCGSYAQAREVLEDLRNNSSRCMIKDLAMTLNGNTSTVSVSATLVFFENKILPQDSVSQGK